MKNHFVLISLILLLNNYKAQSIATDRPSAQTDNSSTLYKNGIQIESGILFPFTNNQLEQISIPNLLLRYGIGDKAELRFSNNLLWNKTKDKFSFNSIQLGTKIQFFKNEVHQVAFLSMIILKNKNSPNGGAINLSLYESIVAKIVGGTSLNNSISMGYTLGYTINSFGSNEGTYSLLISQAINNKFSFFIEFYGSLLYQAYEYNSTINFDLGVAYLLNDKMQIDTYFGTGLNNNMYFGSVGFSYLFLK